MQRNISEKIHLFVSQTYADFYIKYLKEKNALNIESCFDIGADLGTFVNELNNMGINAEGIEQEENKVKNAVTPKIKCATFDVNYNTDKKYDLIALPQVIYFLSDTFEVLKKIKSMLNPNGMIFIVTSPAHSKDHVSKYPDHKLYNKEQYYDMASKSGFEMIDYTEVQSNMGTAFNDGKVMAMFRIIAFQTGMKKPIVQKDVGNHAYILLRLKP